MCSLLQPTYGWIKAPATHRQLHMSTLASDTLRTITESTRLGQREKIKAQLAFQVLLETAIKTECVHFLLQQTTISVSA